jgi:hypothetical protein
MTGAVWSDDDLADVRKLQATARHDRQAWPFAIVALGLVELFAAPFYILPTRPTGLAVQPPGVLGFEPIASTSPWSGIYWVVALAVADCAIAVHYCRVAARRGIIGPVWPFVTSGLLLLVLLVVWTPSIVERIDASLSRLYTATPQLWGRGLAPLLVVALGIVILACTERSLPLTAIAAGHFVAAVVANLYDLANLSAALGARGFGSYALLPNLLLPSLVLLISGCVAAALRRTR